MFRNRFISSAATERSASVISRIIAVDSALMLVGLPKVNVAMGPLVSNWIR
jgi:hypothetical protein